LATDLDLDRLSFGRKLSQIFHNQTLEEGGGVVWMGVSEVRVALWGPGYGHPVMGLALSVTENTWLTDREADRQIGR
jgi:hypothetical protein